MPRKAVANPSIETAHQWTNGGKEVLILKCVAADGSSYGGFRWPLQVGATVEAKDWNPEPVRGGGLSGWAWGLGIGEGKQPDWQGAWIVFGCDPANVVRIDGKCKAKQGVVRFVGPWWKATRFVLSGQMALVVAASEGKASTSGNYSSASTSGNYSSASTIGNCSSASTSGYSSSASTSGYSSSASTIGYSSSASTSGNYSSASTSGNCSSASTIGDYSSASTSGYYSSASTSGNYSSASTIGYSSSASTSGYYSSASTSGNYSSASTIGDYSSASTIGNCSSASTIGDYSSASTIGDASAAVAVGSRGKARAGKFGCVALLWWNQKESRGEMRCAETGCGDGSDGKLKAAVWYRLDEAGGFVEVAV